MLAFQTTAGNRAVTQMLGARRLQRHPGSDEKKDAHTAADHADEKDRKEHKRLEREAERVAQDKADSLDSAQLEEHLLTKLGKKADDPRTEPDDIDMGQLPPKLQAQLRQIQAPISELGSALTAAGDDGEKLAAVRNTFRARIRAGARSWHDNEKKKIPPPQNAASPSPIGQFYLDWRANEAETGEDVPNKQRNKAERQAETLPYREYTAVGWKEGHTKGRLIYDPIDDVFYLSLKHYADTQYFRITGAPRATAAVAPPTSEFDLDFLLFRAYERAAAELAQMAVRETTRVPFAPPTKQDATLDDQLAKMTESAKRYLLELHNLRAAFLETKAAARRKVEAEQNKLYREAQSKALDLKRTQGKNTKGGAATPIPKPEDFKVDEQYADFGWFGQTWVVRASDGYLGYQHGKNKIFPAYTAMTMGDAAVLFRNCVDAGALAGKADDVALVLAAMIVEPTRHPTAALEALFAVAEMNELSPFQSSMRAFGAGGALPMAEGGTDQSGVPLEVQLREARIGRDVVVKVLAAGHKRSPAFILQMLFDSAAGSDPEKVVTLVKDWLLAALQTPEAREELFARKPQKPAATSSPATPAEKSADQADKPQDIAGEQTSSALVSPVTVEVEIPPETSAPGPDEPRGPPAPSRWEGLAAEIRGLPPYVTTISPLMVLDEIASSHQYEEYDNFWDAYDAFRGDYPDYEYGMSPVDVVKRAHRSSPTELMILSPPGWREYDEYREAHPDEFVYLGPRLKK